MHGKKKKISTKTAGNGNRLKKYNMLYLVRKIFETQSRTKFRGSFNSGIDNSRAFGIMKLIVKVIFIEIVIEIVTITTYEKPPV